MRWTRDALKTLVDTARGRNPCPRAEKFIAELDKEYAEEPETPRKRTHRKGLLDWLYGGED